MTEVNYNEVFNNVVSAEQQRRDRHIELADKVKAEVIEIGKILNDVVEAGSFEDTTVSIDETELRFDCCSEAIVITVDTDNEVKLVVEHQTIVADYEEDELSMQKMTEEFLAQYDAGKEIEFVKDASYYKVDEVRQYVVEKAAQMYVSNN
ncbi:hypothetical protein [Corticicoccus populi]|uniref:DUF1617 family protein n=1 Tax=Corticicoccus populi TaxID=1812821 RepID=A0ABW5WS88_9STAP